MTREYNKTGENDYLKKAVTEEQEKKCASYKKKKKGKLQM